MANPSLKNRSHRRTLTGIPEKIDQIEPNTARRTLGVWQAVDGHIRLGSCRRKQNRSPNISWQQGNLTHTQQMGLHLATRT